MALPIRPVIRPALLTGLTNGRLPDSALVDTPGLAGGPLIRLVAPAARAWRALTAAASAAGHTLKATSIADSYRSYEIQDRTFRQRYTTTYLAGRPYRIWNGVRWYQREGTAPAAVPSTSNHGWGLAVDTGEERDQDTGTESMDAATLAWLVAHELDYGFSHELESEPWHIRYTTGDAIPAAVLAYEQGEDMGAKELLNEDVVPNRPWRPDTDTNPNVRWEYAVTSTWDLAHQAADDVAALRAEAGLQRDRLARIELMLEAVTKALAAQGPVVTTATGTITLTPTAPASSNE
jgi:hypothetical protein